MTDILSGILSRGGFAGNPVGQFSNATLILALDIERFVPLADAMADVTTAVNHVVNTPPAEGSHEVMFPGQKEIKNRRERGKQGIEIERDTWDQIMDLVREYNLEDTLGPLPS